MAELSDDTATCCEPAVQAVCCEPAEKASCCGTAASGGSCGCGNPPPARKAVTRSVNKCGSATQPLRQHRDRQLELLRRHADHHRRIRHGSLRQRALRRRRRDRRTRLRRLRLARLWSADRRRRPAPGRDRARPRLGAGADVLISARRVAPTGRAIGLDMTDEMLALARANAAEAGVTNVKFVKGYLEDIPLSDASVDVVISNCVINLAADKRRVLGRRRACSAPVDGLPSPT